MALLGATGGVEEVQPLIDDTVRAYDAGYAAAAAARRSRHGPGQLHYKEQPTHPTRPTGPPEPRPGTAWPAQGMRRRLGMGPRYPILSPVFARCVS